MKTHFLCPATENRHIFGSLFKCENCGENEADWWFEHIDEICKELVELEDESEEQANPVRR